MLGSSRSMLTSTGSLCYDADFYPFGGERDYVNSCPQNYEFAGKERDPETNNDDFDARYYSSAYGRFLSADWSSTPTPVPYANLTNPQTLNLYAIVSDNPESFADLDGHCPPDDSECIAAGDTLVGSPFEGHGAELLQGMLELAGVAVAGPEVLAAGGAATTTLQTLGVGGGALAVAGTAVNGTMHIFGAATNTNVEPGTNAVTTVTNPVAGTVSAATHSMEKGSNAADLVTAVKAGVDIAQGKGVSNPAEAASSLAGAKKAVREIVNSATSAASGALAPTAPPPPSPKPPPAPPCSVAGACDH